VTDLPPLSRSAHDRAAEFRDDDAWIAAAWLDADILPVSADSKVPVRRSGGSAAVDFGRPADHLSADLRLFLGQHDGRRFFAVPTGQRAPVEGWAGLREVGGELDDLEAGLVTSAVALNQWHSTHDHCPRCGAPTEVVIAGWSRRCPVDGSLHFPRTDPAVIMLIHDGGDRCVMGRQATWPVGRFSVLAGFVEAGESAEAAVAREVYEEVGLQVTDIQFIASQPWPFPASLMLGYHARVVGDQTIRRHDGELAEADWFSRADLRRAATWGANDLTDPFAASPPDPDGPRLAALPGGISIARMLVDLWLDAESADLQAR
jgi:NAD+ diphosphatase